MPFAQKSVTPFSADLDLSLAALAAGSFATAYDATLTLKLDREGIRASNLKAKLFGGDLAGLFELKNSEGTGLSHRPDEAERRRPFAGPA